MLRVLGFLLALAVLTWGAVELADNPGRVAIEWQGYRIAMSVGVLMVAVAAVAVLWAFASGLWRWLRAGPGRFMEGRASKRRERGYQVLTQGLVAAAAGDAKTAQRLGTKAGQLVQTPLNLLLLAQAAQLNGDEGAAARYFTAMLDHGETEFLGLRGLIVQATKAGDWQAARTYARRAYDLRPDTEWLNNALFDLEARSGDWRAAQKTLEAAASAKLLDKGAAARRRAVVLAERARTALADDHTGAAEDALVLAREAHKLAPGLVPAAAIAARLLTARGKTRAAAKIIETAWKSSPHPDLALAYGALAPQEAALARTRRFEKLQALNPGHPESHIALAEAALEAELWGPARHSLQAAVVERPTQRVYRLLATLEERRGGDEDALRKWLLCAAAAPPGAAWLCDQCGAVREVWRARCDHCGAFDSLAWKLPPTATQHDRTDGDIMPALTDGSASQQPAPPVDVPQVPE